MKKLHSAFGILALSFWSGFAAEGDSPFTVTPSFNQSEGVTVLTVAIHVPAEHHIYADRLSFEINETAVAAQLPPTRKVTDKFNGGDKEVFEHDFVATLPLAHLKPTNTLTVNLQGCSESECYFPETHQWQIKADHSFAAISEPVAEPVAPLHSSSLTNGFKIAARASGFISSEKFLRFLDRAKGGASDSDEPAFARFGMAATVGLILLGGLALNLTPCVLPMIPINLAILGTGGRNQNRRRGFALGATYGGGMALAYGGLGLVVVLTGSRFGTLNSSPWFNFAIAVVFVVMGFAMFDKLAIDFSRFQRAGSSGKSSGSAFVAAGAMGSFSALLAGACVAPVVISVLLLATTLYQKGNPMGLSLPFILGLGMALPWPLAAAGLSFLPKPGAWMTRVKYGFGVVIFGFALWYGWLGWTLSNFGNSSQAIMARSNPTQDLRAALEKSRENGKPVVVDFWASWCKNCEAMEHSTFKDPKVKQRLAEEFIAVKFQAERLNDPQLKPVLDQFGVLGLPSYLILVPESSKSAGVH